VSPKACKGRSSQHSFAGRKIGAIGNEGTDVAGNQFNRAKVQRIRD
jgi:hypothetical protein